MSGVKWVSVPSSFVFSGEFRLDGEFYSRERLKAQILIEELKKSNIPVSSIEDFSERIFHRPRFRRNYVSKKEGDPYLMPNEIFLFPIKARKFIKDYPEGLRIEPGWILITCSGSVGRTRISDRVLSAYVMSHDLIRVIPEDRSSLGYVYAYLNTWIGQAFLTKTNYGGPIKHIEPHHVANIPIPLLDEAIIREINSKILEAHKMREEAQLKLLEAERLLYEELGLPGIDEDDVEYFGGENGKKVKAFTIKASELDLRFDASYHNPLARTAEKIIRETNRYKRLHSIVKRIYVPNRFKRAYVKDRGIGVPFLQGSHIPMIKFFDVKYIWNKTPNLENISIKPGWILMTRSGTVGQVAISTNTLNGWAASEHIIRIIPGNDINPGYLWMFLTSAYGQIQIKSKIYGGVVDEIAEKDTSLLEQIIVPIPDKSIQDKIGNPVIEAYELKDKANLLEQEAITQLEKYLEELSGVRL